MRADEEEWTARGTDVEVDGRSWDIAGSVYDVKSCLERNGNRLLTKLYPSY